jgi:hypothetical protein
MIYMSTMIRSLLFQNKYNNNMWLMSEEQNGLIYPVMEAPIMPLQQDKSVFYSAAGH